MTIRTVGVTGEAARGHAARFLASYRAEHGPLRSRGDLVFVTITNGVLDRAEGAHSAGDGRPEIRFRPQRRRT